MPKHITVRYKRDYPEIYTTCWNSSIRVVRRWHGKEELEDSFRLQSACAKELRKMIFTAMLTVVDKFKKE